MLAGLLISTLVLGFKLNAVGDLVQAVRRSKELEMMVALVSSSDQDVQITATNAGMLHDNIKNEVAALLSPRNLKVLKHMNNEGESESTHADAAIQRVKRRMSSKSAPELCLVSVAPRQ